MNYILISPESGPHVEYTNPIIAQFLEQHLDQFGDTQSDILKAIAYALNPAKGGFVIICLENEALVGAVVVNKTGMEGYIPSNILVYIAIHRDYRGKGIGKLLMQEAMKNTSGGIALHVEPDNPARFLYQKLGFTNKYLEMRYQPNK